MGIVVVSKGGVVWDERLGYYWRDWSLGFCIIFCEVLSIVGSDNKFFFLSEYFFKNICW